MVINTPDLTFITIMNYIMSSFGFNIQGLNYDADAADIIGVVMKNNMAIDLIMTEANSDNKYRYTYNMDHMTQCRNDNRYQHLYTA